MEGIYVKEFELGINDVDKNNKMKLSTYLKFMQEIGALHSKVYGYCLDTEPITHKAWVVIAWNVDILDKPSWNEKIIVKTWIGKIDKIYFKLSNLITGLLPEYRSVSLQSALPHPALLPFPHTWNR